MHPVSETPPRGTDRDHRRGSDQAPGSRSNRLTRSQPRSIAQPHGHLRIPARNPTHVPNRCSLKPLTPETPEITLLLVCPQRRLTPQVVCRSLPRFQLLKPRPQTRLPTQAPVAAARARRGNVPRDRHWPRGTGGRKSFNRGLRYPGAASKSEFSLWRACKTLSNRGLWRP